MVRKAPAHTTCVLYDPADGSIVLMHTVVTLAGAKPAARKAVEDEARSILSARKWHRKGLRALHPRAGAVKPGVAYEVSRGKLIAAK